LFPALQAQERSFPLLRYVFWQNRKIISEIFKGNVHFDPTGQTSTLAERGKMEYNICTEPQTDHGGAGTFVPLPGRR
jgi:hypothetical protein